jgi:hypothetical protein
MAIKITIPCDACDGHGRLGSADLSSNRTFKCYECEENPGKRVIIDGLCHDAFEAMEDYPNWLEIETRGV